MFKPKPRHLTIFFITVFVIQMILLLVLLLLPAESRAADPVKFIPQVGIPGSSKFSKGCSNWCEASWGTKEEIAKCKQGCGINVGTQVGDKIVSTLLGEYIRDIYKYAVGIVGILAAVVLMFGGVVWLTAGGNQTRIGEAKAWIGASLTGLIIVLTSYMILYTVNPALVNFRPIEVAVVEDKSSGCCEKDGADIGTMSKTACEGKDGKWGGENSVWDETEKKCAAPKDCSQAGGVCAKYKGGYTGQCPEIYIKDYDCEKGYCCMGYSGEIYEIDTCSNQVDKRCYDASDCCSPLSCIGTPGKPFKVCE